MNLIKKKKGKMSFLLYLQEWRGDGVDARAWKKSKMNERDKFEAGWCDIAICCNRQNEDIISYLCGL